MYRIQRTNQKKRSQIQMFNKVILIGRLGQNAEAKTAQNNREYVVLNVATQESWKTDKGDYETRTEWHRVFAWRSLSKFAKTLQKGRERYVNHTSDVSLPSRHSESLSDSPLIG
jgi:single stranded DNA-binding protein